MQPFQLIQDYLHINSIQCAISVLKENTNSSLRSVAINKIKEAALSFESLTLTDQWHLASFKREYKLILGYQFLDSLPIQEEVSLSPLPPDLNNLKDKESQKNLMLFVVTQFLNDYIFSESVLSWFVKEQIQTNLKEEFQRIIEEFGFPTKTPLLDNHKAYIIRLLNGVNLFTQHLAETLENLRDKKTPLDTLSIEKSELLILEGLNLCRDRIKLEKIIAPTHNPKEAHAAMCSYLTFFVLGIFDSFQIKLKKNESLQAIAKSIGNLLATLIQFLFSNERVYLLLNRFINHSFSFGNTGEKQAQSKQPLDPIFSKTIGQLSQQIGNNFLKIAPPKRATKITLENLIGLCCTHTDFLGNTAQKFIIDILNSETRVNLFLVIFQLLWIDQNGKLTPYLIDKEFLQNVLKDKSVVEEKFLKWVQDKINTEIKPEDKPKGFIKKIGSKVVNVTIKAEGSMDDYSSRLSKILFRLLLSPKVIFVLLAYLKESMDKDF